MRPAFARLPITKPVFIHNVLRKAEISMKVTLSVIFCEFPTNLFSNMNHPKVFPSELSTYP